MPSKQKLPKGITNPRPGKFKWDVTVTANGETKRKTGTCNSLAEAVAKQEQTRDALELGKETTDRRSNART